MAEELSLVSLVVLAFLVDLCLLRLSVLAVELSHIVLEDRALDTRVVRTSIVLAVEVSRIPLKMLAPLIHNIPHWFLANVLVKLPLVIGELALGSH